MMDYLNEAKKSMEIADGYFDSEAMALAESYYQSAQITALISIAESLQKLTLCISTDYTQKTGAIRIDDGRG